MNSSPEWQDLLSARAEYQRLIDRARKNLSFIDEGAVYQQVLGWLEQAQLMALRCYDAGIAILGSGDTLNVLDKHGNVAVDVAAEHDLAQLRDQRIATAVQFATAVEQIRTDPLHIARSSLRAHEGRRRGHALAKHVDLSPVDVRKSLESKIRRRFVSRLSRNVGRMPHVRVLLASRFTDLSSAEYACARVLQDRKRDIAIWLAGDEPRLPLLKVPVGRNVGMTLTESTMNPAASARVTIILDRDRDATTGYIIKTAFPDL